MPTIDHADAMPLLARLRAGGALSPSEQRTAARFALQELAQRHPGRSTEVRIPFVGAVQIVEGLSHRRGTPPNVVELDVETFLGVVVGKKTWVQALESGAIRASGTRSDLSEFFPLFAPQAYERW